MSKKATYIKSQLQEDHDDYKRDLKQYDSDFYFDKCRVLVSTTKPCSDGYYIVDRFKIKGISNYQKLAKNVCNMLWASSAKANIMIFPEPTNPYDNNAMAVHGSFKKIISSGQGVIGYIPPRNVKQLQRLKESGSASFVPAIVWRGEAGFTPSVEFFTVFKPDEFS